MATTAVATRQRRESHRPSLSKASLRASTGDVAADRVASAKPVAEPIVRTPDYILQKHKGKPPSFIVHLHPAYFKLEGQDGNFPYNSPMRPLLDHIKTQTVPHEMLEELFQSRVNFYDGCLIVEVHDHKSAAKSAQPGAADAAEARKKSSLHAHNNFITPSPYAPLATSTKAENQTKAEAAARASSVGAPHSATEPNGTRDKENLVPQQGSSEKVASGPRIFTMVLFPTPRSLLEEVTMLANAPQPDVRTAKRQNSRDGTNMAQPPTPLSSVPPTPTTRGPPPNKRQKMVLDSNNIHEFEASVIRMTEPNLLLEPAASAKETEAMLKATAHPLHNEKPPPPKTRKRTVAELAADEAQAAEEERFLLACDDRLGPTAAAVGGAAEGQGAAVSYEPRFSRFKTLETIKAQHEEAERIKKEKEAREAHAKRMQTEAEAQKRIEEQKRAAQMQAAMLANQNRQQEMQQARMRAAAAAQTASANAQQGNMSHGGHPQQGSVMQNPQHTAQFHVSQGQQSSPVLRQHSPLASSPINNASAMNTHGMAAPPMMATSSSHGAGSPARPTSAVSHHQGPVGMVRNISQQQHGSQQGGASRNGTPQMMHGTPSMPQAVPARHTMTPQPRGGAQQRSPVTAMAQTPSMMGESGGTGMTNNSPLAHMLATIGMSHEQFKSLPLPQKHHLANQWRARQAQAAAAAAHQQQQQGGTGMHHAGSPQQANQTSQQVGTPQQQHQQQPNQGMPTTQEQMQRLVASQLQSRNLSPAEYNQQMRAQMQRMVQHQRQQAQQGGGPGQGSPTPVPGQSGMHRPPSQTGAHPNVGQVGPQGGQGMGNMGNNMDPATMARMQQFQQQQMVHQRNQQIIMRRLQHIHGGQLPPNIAEQIQAVGLMGYLQSLPPQHQMQLTQGLSNQGGGGQQGQGGGGQQQGQGGMGGMGMGAMGGGGGGGGGMGGMGGHPGGAGPGGMMGAAGQNFMGVSPQQQQQMHIQRMRQLQAYRAQQGGGGGQGGAGGQGQMGLGGMQGMNMGGMNMNMLNMAGNMMGNGMPQGMGRGMGQGGMGPGGMGPGGMGPGGMGPGGMGQGGMGQGGMGQGGMGQGGMGQ
ncbi:Spt20 family-domain-containing protein [Lineolata rhizophorae]|uniref:Spt20 family-domain-containing protein n=1 Tax=Lineolata rhizophorae TaxID=578093 RepID=A0A6A6PE17_9PEZI|nr:Spt20 family-domain-containing protein [Lineolata rhizophorae]